MTNKILRLPEVRDTCGLSRSSIYLGMKLGTFPKTIRLGTRMVGWIQQDIDDWIESKLLERENGGKQ